MADNQVPGTFAAAGFAGVGSASAQAERQRLGLEETPSGKDRGSTLNAGQDDAVADAVAEGASPAGLQAEDAIFTRNGSVAGNLVPSPSGPVPISLTATDSDDAVERLEKRREELEQEQEGRDPDRKFSEAEISQLDGGVLRAIAERRGYDLPGAGTRSARTAFLRQQGEDKNYKSTSRAASKSTGAAAEA